MKPFLAAMLMAAAVATPLTARSEPLDGVVAAVEYNAVMLSTLRAYRLAYAPQATPIVALTQLIDDALLAREANRYGLTIENEEVRKSAAKTPIPGTLTRPEWETLVANHLLAQRFLDFRFGEFVPIARDEVRAYYEAHRDRFPGPLDAAEEEIRTLLAPTVRARREATYKEELRLRYQVRLNESLLAAP